jgi:hypothetical protein
MLASAFATTEQSKNGNDLLFENAAAVILSEKFFASHPQWTSVFLPRSGIREAAQRKRDTTTTKRC